VSLCELQIPPRNWQKTENVRFLLHAWFRDAIFVLDSINVSDGYHYFHFNPPGREYKQNQATYQICNGKRGEKDLQFAIWRRIEAGFPWIAVEKG
jgi:hypothetical protein